MIYRIEWSQRSRRDLDAISAYVELQAPLAAARLSAALIETAESLATHPHRGWSLYGTVREIVVIRPYLIRYRVTTAAVQIMRIKQQRTQTWPSRRTTPKPRSSARCG